eukprot:COSAG01_NODE_46053_length_403_cov_3.157895_1_plen_61_part_01
MQPGGRSSKFVLWSALLNRRSRQQKIPVGEQYSCTSSRRQNSAPADKTQLSPTVARQLMPS